MPEQRLTSDRNYSGTGNALVLPETKWDGKGVVTHAHANDVFTKRHINSANSVGDDTHNRLTSLPAPAVDDPDRFVLGGDRTARAAAAPEEEANASVSTAEGVQRKPGDVAEQEPCPSPRSACTDARAGGHARESDVNASWQGRQGRKRSQRFDHRRARRGSRRRQPSKSSGCDRCCDGRSLVLPPTRRG